MKDVIVVGMNYSTALGIIRSLGEAGYRTRLLALNVTVALIAGKSKYVVKCIRAKLEFGSFWNAMEKLRGNDSKILVIPIHDRSCRMLDEHAEQFSSHYWIPNINSKAGAVADFMDKMKQKEMAMHYGLCVAKGKQYSTNENGIKEAILETIFPCFLKPLASARMIASKTIFAKCYNSNELVEAMKNAANKGCEKVLVEEFLDIEKELCLYGMAANGNVFIPACIITHRSGFAQHKGVAAEGEVIPSSNLGEICGHITEFVKGINLTGLFCIDLIQSKGEVFFSEINMRGGGSGYAVTLAGANLPLALAETIYNRSTDGPYDIKHQISFLNEMVEFDAFTEGYISWEEFRHHISNKLERFIKSDEDPKPWNLFVLLTVYKYLKNTARRIVSR